MIPKEGPKSVEEALKMFGITNKKEKKKQKKQKNEEVKVVVEEVKKEVE